MKRRRRRRRGPPAVPRLRCCRRFAYWRGGGDAWRDIWGHWACTECGAELGGWASGHAAPGYVVAAFAAALAELPRPTLAELAEIRSVFRISICR